MTAQWQANCNDGISSVGGSKEFSYTGNVQTFNACAGRTYKLEVWGGQGGSGGGGSIGGYGGYSYGAVQLQENQVLYIYVGKQGVSYSPLENYNVGQGGGASDIALRGSANTTTWNTNDHFYSRIIVAGGGGGAGYSNGKGGNGGGYIGGNGTANKSSQFGYGGSQTSGGSSGAGGRYNDDHPGYFGYVSEASSSEYNNTNPSKSNFNGGGNTSIGESGGGGSGWYSGGTGRNGEYGGGGGGGSGYIYNSASESSYPTGKLVNSSFYLTDAGMYMHSTGCTSSTATAIKTTCTGSTGAHAANAANTGDGYAKITRQS